MLIFLLSLTGIPATGGFMGKFFVFGAAVQHQYFWLVVVALINVGISAFYYLNVVRAMFFVAPDEAVEERNRPAPAFRSPFLYRSRSSSVSLLRSGSASTRTM